MEENTKSNLDSTNSQQTSSVANDAQTPSAPPVSNADKPSGSLEQKAKAAQPKFSVGAIIGIIIFLLVAGGAAASFTVFRPQIVKLISKPTPTPTITIRTSPTPTPDPTAGWKTYTNNKHHFTIKYPPFYRHGSSVDVNKDEKSSYAIKNLDLEQWFGPGEPLEGTGGYTGDFITLKVYPDSGDSWSNIPPIGPNNETINLDGQKALKQIGVGIITIGPINHKGTIYEFQYDLGYEKNQNQTAFYTMLSSFKFTENSVDNQPALERQDEDTRNTLIEFSNASIRYYTTHAGFPWSTTGPCQSSATATPNGTSLSQMVPCISLLIDEGELKGSFLSTNGQSISKIFVNSQNTNLTICYKPSSIKEQAKPETTYDVYGKVDKSCSTTDNKCFWCSSI